MVSFLTITDPPSYLQVKLYFPEAFTSPKKCFSVQQKFSEQLWSPLSLCCPGFPYRTSLVVSCSLGQAHGLPRYSIPDMVTQARANGVTCGAVQFLQVTRARGQKSSLWLLAQPPGSSRDPPPDSHLCPCLSSLPVGNWDQTECVLEAS